MMSRNFQKWFISIVCAALSGCQSFKNTLDEPVTSADTTRYSVVFAWQKDLPTSASHDHLSLYPVDDREHLYAVSRKGSVAAFSKTGQEAWETQIKETITSGVTKSSDGLYFTTTRGHLYKINPENGSILSQQKLSSESLTSPQIYKNMVIVQTIDGRIAAYNTNHEPHHNNAPVWHYEERPSALMVRSATDLKVVDDKVIAAFSNGKVCMLYAQSGEPVWSALAVLPVGRTEISRLTDITAPLGIRGDMIYVASHQGKVSALSYYSGQPLWERELSAIRGLVLSDEDVIVTTAQGEIIAMDLKTGSQHWKQLALTSHRLSQPGFANHLIAVASHRHKIYLLDAHTGDFVAESPYNGAEILSRPWFDGKNLSFQTAKDEVLMYNVVEKN